MSVYFEGASIATLTWLENINLFFTMIFALEAFFKLIAFGFRYFKSGWNKFDFFVVLSSFIDIILEYMGQSNTSASFLRIGPQLARILRVLRVSRVLRLISKSKGLQALIQTIVFSLASLINVFSLLMLVFFIYSILGVFLFSEITNGVILDPYYMNFTNFSNSMILLLRVSTGEDWNRIMFDCWTGTNNPFTPAYFISFIVICTYVMLNLFVLVILQQFDKYYLPTDNIISKFKDNLEYFKLVWNKSAIKHGGLKIRES